MSIQRSHIICPVSCRSAFTVLAGILAALCIFAATGRAQFEITVTSGNTSQSFDGPVIEGPVLNGIGPNVWVNDTTFASGDSTFNGWSLFTYTNQPIASYGALGGATTAGGFYSFGSTSATDRALGGIGSESTYFGSPAPASDTVAGYIAFAATNNSGGNIGSFTLGFDGEQWRNGGSTSIQNMVFEYGFGSTFGTVATWTAPGDDFDWSSPIIGATASAVEGNGPGLVTGRGGAASGLLWTTGETLWLRWIERNDTGNDHGLAIDNFTLAWQAGPPPRNLTWAATNGAWDTTAVNWVDQIPVATAFIPGDSVNFSNSGLSQNTITVAPGGVNSGPVAVSHTSGTYTIGGGAISSNQPLQKTGAGTLVLGTSFSQGLNAQGGVVRLATGGDFGNTSSVTFGEGTTFELDGNAEIIGALTATGATVTTGGANLTVNGPTTLSTAILTAGTGLLTFNGFVTLTDVAIATAGAGQTVINGNVSVQPSLTDMPTTISGRLSTGSGDRTYTIAGGSTGVDLDLAASIEGTGRLSLMGSGAVRLGGNNSAHNGGFQLNAGLGYFVEGATAFGTGILFFNGGTIEAGVELTGANKITTPVRLGGPFAEFRGEDIEFGGALSFSGANFAKIVSIEADQTVIFSGLLDSSEDPLSDSGITKTGEGTLVLRASADLYVGEVSVEVGEIVAATAGSLGSGDVVVGLGLTTDPDATLTIHGSQTISSLTIGHNGVVVLTAAAPEASVPATSSVAVPESSGLALLLCGALGLLSSRRGRAQQVSTRVRAGRISAISGNPSVGFV